jgi:hypothetical protein
MLIIIAKKKNKEQKKVFVKKDFVDNSKKNDFVICDSLSNY